MLPNINTSELLFWDTSTASNETWGPTSGPTPNQTLVWNGSQMTWQNFTASSISADTHKTLAQLVHLAENGGPFQGFGSSLYQETTPAGSPFPTKSVWWTSSAKTKKIVEENVTYNANKTIATDQWIAYAADGVTVTETSVDTISYLGVFETHRTRTLT